MGALGTFQGSFTVVRVDYSTREELTSQPGSWSAVFDITLLRRVGVDVGKSVVYVWGKQVIYVWRKVVYA